MRIKNTSVFLCTNFSTFAVALSRVSAHWWHGRSYASVFPHHLWPPVEPWRGCCRRRSAPGRYSNRHLPAAQMRWWGLRWVTPRSDCWAAGVGWERANSAGRRTNSQLVRTWNRYSLEIHTYTHTSQHVYSLMTWFHTYSSAKPEAPLCYEGNFCSCWLHDCFPLCFNTTAVLSCLFAHRDHPIPVELRLNITQYIFRTAKEEGVIIPTYIRGNNQRTDDTFFISYAATLSQRFLFWSANTLPGFNYT